MLDEALERSTRRVIVLVEHQHLSEGVESCCCVVETPELRLRKTKLEVDELRLVGQEINTPRQDLGEGRPIFGGRIESIERLESRDVFWELLENRLKRVSRRAEIAELFLVNARDTGQERELLVGIRKHLAPGLADSKQLGPRFGLGVERFERAKRFAVIRLRLDDGTVSRNASFTLTRVLYEGARERQTQADGGVEILRVFERRNGRFVGRDDVSPVLDDARDPLEIRLPSRVARGDGERFAETCERSLLVVDARFVELCELPQNLEFLVVSLHVGELHFENVDQAFGVLGLLVNGDQALGRLAVLRIESEHLLVGANRAFGATLLGRPELTDLQQHAGALLGVLAASLLTLKNADELVPVGVRLVEILEIVPPTQRDVALLELLLVSALSGLQLDELAIRFGGTSIVLETVAGDLRQLEQERGPLGAARALD